MAEAEVRGQFGNSEREERPPFVAVTRILVNTVTEDTILFVFV